MKKTREFLFYLNNVLQLLFSLLLILTGIGILLECVIWIIQNSSAGFGFALGLPIIAGFSVYLLVPYIILGIISAIAVVFAAIKLMVKKKKLIFAVINLILIYLSAILLIVFQNLSGTQVVIKEYVNGYQGFYGVFGLLNIAPAVIMIMNFPLAVLTLMPDKESEENFGE